MRARRGQALLEFALLLPTLGLVLVGALDLGRGYHYGVEVVSAARAGARTGANGDGTDLGAAIRSEPNPGIPDDVPTWGAMATGQPDSCDGTGATLCGDPGGCAVPFSGSNVACFAVRTCALSGGGDLGTSCTPGPWGSRPVAGGTARVLEVLVIYKMSTYTPFVAQLTALTGNGLYLRSEIMADQLY